MVIMEHVPYIPPTTRILPVQFDPYCVITTSHDPFLDNGEYEWSDED